MLAAGLPVSIYRFLERVNDSHERAILSQSSQNLALLRIGLLAGSLDLEEARTHASDKLRAARRSELIQTWIEKCGGKADTDFPGRALPWPGCFARSGLSSSQVNS
jgi:hypothetical protein